MEMMRRRRLVRIRIILQQIRISNYRDRSARTKMSGARTMMIPGVVMGVMEVEMVEVGEISLENNLRNCTRILPAGA